MSSLLTCSYICEIRYGRKMKCENELFIVLVFILKAVSYAGVCSHQKLPISDRAFFHWRFSVGMSYAGHLFVVGGMGMSKARAQRNVEGACSKDCQQFLKRWRAHTNAGGTSHEPNSRFRVFANPFK